MNNNGEDFDRGIYVVAYVVLIALATLAGGVLLGVMLAWRGM